MMLVSDTLVSVRCWCGLEHAIPKSLHEEQLRQRDAGRPQVGIYCPLGHSWISTGKSRTKELEEQLQRERQRRDQAEMSARDARVEAEANAKKLARLKKRVGNGVCPCCNRTFTDLQRHMKCKHPGMVKP